VRAAYKSYSESSEILSMIDAARKHIEENPNRYIGWRRVKGKLKKTTFCYRAVKDAMKAAGVVSSDFVGGGEAKLAVAELSAVGFRNLLDDENVNEILQNSPEMAPKGAILVYDTVPRSGPSPAGHIEIKTEESGEDGYISVSETNAPTYGYAIPAQRRLIGVMMKNQTRI
jgi:hypothetical protein